MRPGLLLAALLALSGLAVHLAVPFAVVQTLEEGETPSATLSRQDMAQRVELGVPGASFGYLLAGAIVLAVGGLLLLVSMTGRASLGWVGGLLAGAGAAMSLHGNGLWVGRGAASLVHHAFTGADVPAAAHADWMGAAGGDQFWSIIPSGPLLMTALSLTVIVLLARAWPRLVRDERRMHEMSRQHARGAVVGALVLLAVAMVPWTVQELPDDPEAADGGSHVYFWSAYDILQKREAGLAVAEATNEGGFVVWNGLSLALQLALLAGVAAVVAGLLGLAGRHLESMGQAVPGRLLENASLIAVPAHVAIAAVGVLGAFALQDPNGFEESVVTGLPLVATFAGAWGVFVAGSTARHVIAVDADIVADDYPEPVVYD